MNRFSVISINRRLVLGTILVLVGLLPFIAYFLNKVPEDTTPSPIKFRRYPGPKQEIKGFQYNGYRNGDKFVSIHAKKLVLHKKKIGVFSFGLLNELLIDDAVIRLFGKRDFKNKAADRFIFTATSAFSKEILPMTKGQRISSLIIEPIVFEFTDGEDLISRIRASKARIEPKNKTVLFRGDVVVESGNNVLRSDKIELLADGTLLIKDRYFYSQADYRQCTGVKLKTDFLLKSIWCNQ